MLVSQFFFLKMFSVLFTLKIWCICVCIIKGSTDQIAHSLLKSQPLGRKENILQVVCQWGCIRKWNSTMFFLFLESDFFVSLSHRFEKYGNKLLCYEVTKMWSLPRNFVIHARNLCSLLRTCCLALGYKDKWALSCLWFCSKCLSPLDEKLLGLVLFPNFWNWNTRGREGVFLSFFFSVQPSRWLSSNLMITDIARGLIQFHSTPYWTEMRAKFFLSSGLPVPLWFPFPHISGVATKEQRLLHSPSHP